MSEELEVRESEELAIPLMQTLVRLDDVPLVAQTIIDIKQGIGVLMEARRVLEAAIIAESQRQGAKTLHLDPFLYAEVRDDKELVWDIDVLEELLDAGLPQERYDKLVVGVVTYKVSANVANQLARAGNEQYAEIIGRARTYNERQPRVTVRRQA